MKNNSALAAGSDLWVLVDDESGWWKKINFHTGFLLSALKKHQTNSFTRSVSNETDAILAQTEFPKINFKSISKLTYVASQNHFQNRWICLLENVDDIHTDEFMNNACGLQCNNIRFFFQSELSPGLKASFPNAEFISDSQ